MSTGGQASAAHTPARRVAVVTGAAGIVGAAVVERLQAEGFMVGALDPEVRAGDLKVQVDVTDRVEMRGAAERVNHELGPISVLVTAPYYHDAAPFGEMSADRWQQLLMAHLGGTASACAAVVPSMLQAGRGSVITVSSWLALAGVAGEAYYAAAAGSILAFSKSFALEVARHGVRVNCIAAGPGDRVLSADVADTVVFLINDGDFFVGQVFCPAGGAVV